MIAKNNPSRGLRRRLREVPQGATVLHDKLFSLLTFFSAFRKESKAAASAKPCRNILLLIPILLIFSVNTLHAEEGEWQFYLGGGGYFPLTMTTDDKTVLVYSSWGVTGKSYFGITDNFDIGLQFSFSMLNDTRIDKTFNGLEGREYFNYNRMQLAAIVRYNLFPGYSFSPHVFAGIGTLIETFRDRQFYTKNDKLVTDFDGDDYARAHIAIPVGIDLQYRVWEFLLLNLEFFYTFNPYSHALDLNFMIGARWFMKSYYF